MLNNDLKGTKLLYNCFSLQLIMDIRRKMELSKIYEKSLSEKRAKFPFLLNALKGQKILYITGI